MTLPDHLAPHQPDLLPYQVKDTLNKRLCKSLNDVSSNCCCDTNIDTSHTTNNENTNSDLDRFVKMTVGRQVSQSDEPTDIALEPSIGLKYSLNSSSSPSLLSVPLHYPSRRQSAPAYRTIHSLGIDLDIPSNPPKRNDDVSDSTVAANIRIQVHPPPVLGECRTVGIPSHQRPPSTSVMEETAAQIYRRRQRAGELIRSRFPEANLECCNEEDERNLSSMVDKLKCVADDFDRKQTGEGQGQNVRRLMRFVNMPDIHTVILPDGIGRLAVTSMELVQWYYRM